MSLCTKCKIDKPSTEFQSYWHSTQQTERTRKVCRSCFNEQKKELRLKKKMLAEISINPDLVYKDNPNYKKCARCETWKTKDQYYEYKNKIFGKCLDCKRIEEKEKAVDKLEDNGGSLRVKVHPNQYNDEFQRKNTFELMTIMGYLFNEEKGIWYKEPWKTKDGEFPLVKKGRPKSVKTNIPKVIKERIVEYRKLNYSIGKISAIVNVSETSVWKICQNISK